MNIMILDDILILLAAAVVVVALFKRINLPSVLAYLFIGVALGSHGLAWISDSEGTRFLAEFGVVFLMFTVGLEFSLPHLIAMKKEVLGYGGAQVVLTTLVAGSIAWLLGVPPAAAFVVGGILAMSSTAIVIKQLTERLEITSRHGRKSVGVLLFQDIAVVPLLIMIPLLGNNDGGETIALEVLWALVKGVVVVVVMLAVGHWFLRPIFHRIAAMRSSELFTLTALLFALAAAWTTFYAGLSLAFGAFLAGMLLGETEFKHQIEADIRPLRDVLLGLFFVTVGMLLDIQVMLSLLPWIVLLAVAIVLFKTLSIMGVGMVMGAPKGVALRTGIVLAQGGEFGLALLALALSEGVLASSPSQITLAAIIVTMALAPLLINYNGHLAKWLFAGSYGRNREQIVEEVTESAAGLREHVIICGYGRIGQNIARFLDQEGFQYCAMDLDPVIVKEARAAGDRVSYGDSTHNDILEAAGLKQAKVLVVSYNEVHSALKIIEQARRIRPDIPILVRTADDANLDRLQQMGATEVVPETLEASLMLASHVLLLMDVPMARIIRRVQGVRRNRYQMLRGFFHGQESESLEQADAFRERMHTVTLLEEAYAINKTLQELTLESLNVVVTAVRRGGIRSPQPLPDMRLNVADTLVLYGLPEDLARAEERILKG